MVSVHGATSPRALPMHGEVRVHHGTVPALWQKGFRPFFLAAAFFGMSSLGLWLFVISGHVVSSSWLDPMMWHGHEMIFGLAAAVLAGFLLTAVGNWTSRETAIGWPLAGLLLLWASARVLYVIPTASPLVLACVDLAFLPTLAVVLARPIWQTRNRRNFIMVGGLALLWGTNVLMHLDALGVLGGWRRPALYAGLDVVLMFVAIMSGRVIPMFTRNATGVATTNHVRLDQAAAAAMGLLAVSELWAPHWLLAVLACLAMVIGVVRALSWGTLATFRQPLLWILHLAYWWLPLGLLLRALSLAGLTSLPEVLGIHGLTVGCLSSLMLGMMARVTMGHTGRPLQPSRITVMAFWIMASAGIARVGVPLINMQWYSHGVHIAGGNAAVAWALFLVAHAKWLVSPRLDGKAG